MLFGDPSAPIIGGVFFEWFGFSDSSKWIAFYIINDAENMIVDFTVFSLPCFEVRPRFIGKRLIHALGLESWQVRFQPVRYFLAGFWHWQGSEEDNWCVIINYLIHRFCQIGSGCAECDCVYRFVSYIKNCTIKLYNKRVKRS